MLKMKETQYFISSVYSRSHNIFSIDVMHVHGMQMPGMKPKQREEGQE